MNIAEMCLFATVNGFLIGFAIVQILKLRGKK